MTGLKVGTVTISFFIALSRGEKISCKISKILNENGCWLEDEGQIAMRQ